MYGLLKCFLYLAVIGVIFFLLGRAIPKKWMHYDRFPYCPFPFEKNGKGFMRFSAFTGGGRNCRI